ncbi:MAG: hypothetical protein ABFD15_06035 [Methanofastidiosum sp.]
MKIESSLVKKVAVTDIKNPDPISIYLEDYAQGQGKLIITCYDKSWTYYWGAMGSQNLAQFVATCDNHYLAKKLDPNTKSNIYDEDAMEKYAKEHIIDLRKHDDISKEDARKLYDECYRLSSEYDLKNIDSNDYADLMYEIFGDEWYDCLPTKPNPDYQYLCRILDVVREVLKENK